MHHFWWKISILYERIEDCEKYVRGWQASFQLCKDQQDHELKKMSKCDRDLNFYWYLRVLSNIHWEIGINYQIDISIDETKVDFNWNQEQCEFINRLKFVLILLFVFIIVDYFERAEQITLTVDANLIDWKAVLMQIKNDKRHSIRYKSAIWSFVKRAYDVIKRKCRDVFKSLKRIRFWLYEVYFILKTNAKMLIVQFNRFEIDLSNVFITK